MTPAPPYRTGRARRQGSPAERVAGRNRRAPTATALLVALGGCGPARASLPLPLALPGVRTARGSSGTPWSHQLDDYLLPRLRRLDAPLLAVVGGSTGAGKSTLVNSLLRAPVSRSGVLRPTTRSPVLVHHPDDAAWFAGDRVLPSLARVTGACRRPGRRRRGRRPVATRAGRARPRDHHRAPGVRRGAAGRAGAAGRPRHRLRRRGEPRAGRQLLAAADLWLFVTTAARYADAVPWDLLRTAVERGTQRGRRARPRAAAAPGRGRGPTWRRMLRGRRPGRGAGVHGDRDPPRRRHAARRDGRAAAPLAHVAGLGRPLPAGRGAPHARRRGGVAAATGPRAGAAAADAQAVGAGRAARRPRRGVARGRPPARAGTHRRVAAARRGAGPLAGVRRDRGPVPRPRERGRPPAGPRRRAPCGAGRPPAEPLGEALQTGVTALVRAEAEDAVEAGGAALAGAARRGGPARAPAGARPALAEDFDERLERMVRDWQRAVLELVRTEGQGRRSQARVLSLGVNAARRRAHAGGVRLDGVHPDRRRGGGGCRHRRRRPEAARGGLRGPGRARAGGAGAGRPASSGSSTWWRRSGPAWRRCSSRPVWTPTPGRGCGSRGLLVEAAAAGAGR